MTVSGETARLANASRGQRPRMEKAAFVLAIVAILSSACHFWPFEGNRAWELFCPANVAVYAWCVLLGATCVRRRSWAPIRDHLPHAGFLAYMVVGALSVAQAPDSRRAVACVVKLLVTVMGVHTLVRHAARVPWAARRLYDASAAGVALSVFYCLWCRWGAGSSQFGFFASALKYGTFIGILAPMCAVPLLLGGRVIGRLFGGALILASVLSAGTLGCLLAVLAGMGSAIVACRRWPTKGLLGVALVGVCGICAVLWQTDVMAPMRRDAALAEADGANCRQRYLEWQAYINLLAERPICGTGIGCINVYRSAYYNRLPKVNTLQSYDQNGWLTVPAETGIIGLACFGWGMAYYLALVWRRIRSPSSPCLAPRARYDLGNLAALVAACVGGIFSSVHFNGVLIALIVVMALSSTADVWPQTGERK